MNISEHLFHSDQNVRYPMSEFPGFWAKRASSLASVLLYSFHVVFWITPQQAGCTVNMSMIVELMIGIEGNSKRLRLDFIEKVS